MPSQKADAYQGPESAVDIEENDQFDIQPGGDPWGAVAAQWESIEFIFSLKYEKKIKITALSDGKPVIKYRASQDELEIIQFALSRGRKALSLFNEKSEENEYDILAWHYLFEASFHAGVIFASCEFSTADRERILHRNRSLADRDIVDKENKQIWYSKQLLVLMSAGLKRKDAEEVLRLKITEIRQRGGLGRYAADWFLDFCVWQEVERPSSTSQPIPAGTALNISRTFGQRGIPDKEVKQYASRNSDDLPPSIEL